MNEDSDLFISIKKATVPIYLFLHFQLSSSTATRLQQGWR